MLPARAFTRPLFASLSLQEGPVASRMPRLARQHPTEAPELAQASASKWATFSCRCHTSLSFNETEQVTRAHCFSISSRFYNSYNSIFCSSSFSSSSSSNNNNSSNSSSSNNNNSLGCCSWIPMRYSKASRSKRYSNSGKVECWGSSLPRSCRSRYNSSSSRRIS